VYVIDVHESVSFEKQTAATVNNGALQAE